MVVVADYHFSAIVRRIDCLYRKFCNCPFHLYIILRNSAHKRLIMPKNIKNILFSLIVFLAFLILSEAGTRVYLFIKYKNPIYFKFDLQGKSGGWRYRDQKIIDIKIPHNFLKFRGPEIGQKKGIRICSLGGSSTFGVGVEADETYSYYLGELLQVEVINCGFPAMQMEDIYSLFKDRVIFLEPDIIAVYSAYNDATKPKLITRKNLFWRMHYAFYSRWMLYTAVLEKYSRLKHNTDVPFFDLPRTIPQKYAQYLRLLVSLAKEKGIEVVLIKQSLRDKCEEYGDYSKEKLEELYRNKQSQRLPSRVCILVHNYYLKQMEEIGKENSLLVIETNLDRDKFLNKLHLTKEGNKELAEIVAKDLMLEFPMLKTK